ncbi:50S ribosomal protein L13 [Candidatus Giovannonibacteria bacterium]|nr:50S ribosomal protein L13 [Candidatus Giovannonibacteria bacterium]
MKEVLLDAKGKRLGRMATQIASILRGKNSVEFLPNRIGNSKVVVKNADYMDLIEKKIKTSYFARYSGYPGGRKVRTVAEIASKDKREVLRLTVWGMLPKNKLRKQMIKNLTICHGEDR